MIRFRLSEIEQPLEARRLGADRVFSSVSTDTRALGPGNLFVALQGPRFDGHDYLTQAQQRGAVAAMVHRETEIQLPQLLVEDTRIGLGQLARLWRQASNASLVAVTGSNGKTTVKEMLAAILSFQGSVLATRGNLNNDIGLPLTLLRLQEHDYAVVELGANHSGEIEYLSQIAQPDVALLNNAGHAHLEGFGSLEGVARAKGEIISGLAEDGHFVFNADDPWAPLWQELAQGHPTRSFGSREPADVWSPPGALELRWNDVGFLSRFPVTTPQGELEIECCLAGEHNRMNALAAIATAQILGAGPEEIRAGFEQLEPVKGRLQPLAGRNGVGLIDDSYNANPDSVAAAIHVLATAPGRRFMVLGELAELGPGANRFYQGIAELARSAGIDHLYAVDGAGQTAEIFGPGGRAFPTQELLIDGLEQILRSGDRVLVKGSRRAGMERVIAALADRGEV